MKWNLTLNIESQIYLLKNFGNHQYYMKFYNNKIVWWNYHRQNSEINWNLSLCLYHCTIKKELEQALSSNGTKPTDAVVELNSGQQVSAPCFYLKSMVLTSLHNMDLIKEKKYIKSLNIFAERFIQGRTPLCGDIHIHTGDA